MQRSRQNNKFNLLQYISKFWYVFVLIILAIPFIHRYYQNQKIKNKKNYLDNVVTNNNNQNSSQSPNIIKTKTDSILKGYKFPTSASRLKLISDAKALAHHLGTMYMVTWYDFIINRSSWTENDNEIEKLLKQQTHNYPILEKLYFSVHTQSRNLSNDLNKFLDDDNKKRVKNHWLTYGKSYL